MVTCNEFHPLATRNRTPAPLTSLERAHTRQGLDSWRTTILRDFYDPSDSKQTVLPDAVIDNLLDKSALFTTPETISQFLGNAVKWDPLLKKYWAFQIFDIFFPVEDPVSTTQAYDGVFWRAFHQARSALEAWRKKTFQADYARILDDFGSNCTREDLLSDAKLNNILRAFTRFEGSDSIYPITGWVTRQSGYYEQVWEQLQPMITACAHWKAKARSNTAPPQPSPVSSIYDPEQPNPLGIKACHPVATRSRTPAPLTSLERAHARQGLNSWRTRTWHEFEGDFSRQIVLPDDAIDGLLDNSAQFTTLVSISRFLSDKVSWIEYQTYWTLQIFDILFPVEDPVLSSQAYKDVLRTAKIQVRKTLVAWRAMISQAEFDSEEDSEYEEEDDILPDAILDIFEERFTSLDSPRSIMYVIPWSPRDGRKHRQQVWDRIQPMVTECASWKDILSTKAQTKLAAPLPSTQSSLPSTPATKPPPMFSEATTPEFLKVMDTTDTIRPLATRTRTPAPLTNLERAHARQGLESWRTRISREFETKSCIPIQTVLPDSVIDSLLEESAQFTTSESISQYLYNKVDWHFCQKYWCLDIFDILFRVEDPISMTPFYQATLTTAKAQVRETLVAWRTKTVKDRKHLWDELGFNVAEQLLLSDDNLGIIEERFTGLDGPYSVYPLTAWSTWDALEHYRQVWELLRPMVKQCATVKLYITKANAKYAPSPSLSLSSPTTLSPWFIPQITAKIPSTAATTNETIQENHSGTGTEATKEQVMKSLRVWRCRTYKSDYRAHNNIFNVEAVMPNSVIKQLADQRAKIKTASTIPSIVQWKPQQQRYLQEIYEILC